MKLSVLIVSGPGFEPDISRISNRGGNHSHDNVQKASIFYLSPDITKAIKSRTCGTHIYKILS
jgi:hypothetical protein